VPLCIVQAGVMNMYIYDTALSAKNLPFSVDATEIPTRQLAVICRHFHVRRNLRL
jgi:hypothetical protein